MLSKEALSHRTYVEGVMKYYRDSDIQPGDPNEGIWHQAHYPLPKRLGGQTVVLLLAKHHAVQGVLQSEEFGCCCVSGEFMKYMRGTEYEERMSYWLGEQLRSLNAEPWSPERRARHGQKQGERFERDGVSDETRRRQSAAHLGKPRAWTEEWRENIRRSMARPESRAKRSAAAKQSRIDNPEKYTDGFIVYDVQTGRIAVYPDRITCSDRIRISKTVVTRATKEMKAIPRNTSPITGEKRRYLIKKQ